MQFLPGRCGVPGYSSRKLELIGASKHLHCKFILLRAQARKLNPIQVSPLKPNTAAFGVNNQEVPKLRRWYCTSIERKEKVV